MKKYKNISLRTLPNGYALDVEDKKYMYFSLEGLIKGFMLHVGLSEKDYCNKEFINDFIATAVSWKTGDGDIVKKNIELSDENKRLLSTIQTDKKKIKILKDKIVVYEKGSKRNTKNDEDDEEDEE